MVLRGNSRAFEALIKIVTVRQRKDKRQRCDIYVKPEELDRVIKALRVQARRKGWRVRRGRSYRQRIQAKRDQPPSSLIEESQHRDDKVRTGLVSWNINGLRHKVDGVNDLCARESVAVVALQETLRKTRSWCCNINGMQTWETPFDPSTAGARGIILGVAEGIASKLVSMSPFFVCAQVGGCKSFPYPVHVASVYIPNPGSSGSRGVAWRELRKWVMKLQDSKQVLPSMLLMGDFNTKTTALKRKIASWGVGLALVECRGSRRSRFRVRKSKSNEASQVDHMLATPDVAKLLNSMRVLRNEDLSDHWPLLSHLRPEEAAKAAATKGAEPLTPKKFRMKAVDVKRKAAEIALHNRWHCLEVVEPDSAENLEVYTRKFEEVSKEIATELKVWKEMRVWKSKERFLTQPDTKRAIKRRQKFYNAWKCDASSSFKRERYREAAKQARVLLKRDKKVSFDNHVKEVGYAYSEGDTKAVWNWVAKLKTNSKAITGVQPVRGNDGQLITVPEKILQAWSSHFAKLAADETGHSRDAEFWRGKVPVFRAELSGLNDPIGWEEVNATLRRIQGGKAPGADGLIPEWFKAAIDELEDGHSPPTKSVDEPATPMGRFILKLVKGIWENSYIPPTLQSATVVAIPKKGGKAENMDDYRGISLIAIALKITTTLIAQRLMKQLERQQLLIPEQAGFRTREECMAQVISLYEVVQRRKLCNKKTYACFIDLKKAYDVVPHEALLAKLEAIGVRGKSLAFFRALYKENYIRVRQSCGLSEKTLLKRGVRQGCSASTILFNVFINDILDDMHGLGVSVPGVREKLKGLLFADDLVLLAPSRRVLKLMMEKVSQWADRWEMKVGAAKCGVMAFFQDPAVMKAVEWTMQGEIIPIVETYTYLGIEVTSEFDLKLASKSRLEKARGVLHSVRSILTLQRLPLKIRVNIFRAIVMPTLTYGGELFGMDTARASPMQTLINGGMRWIIGLSALSTQVSTSCLMEELQIPPVAAILAARRARLLRKSTELWTWLCRLVQNPPPPNRKSTWVKGAQRWMKVHASSVDPATKLAKAAKQVEAIVWERTRKTTRANVPLSWHLYTEAKFNLSAGGFKKAPWDAAVNGGVVHLIKARCNTLMTCAKLAQARLIHRTYLKECPFCDKPFGETRPHLLLTCKRWAAHRERSGLDSLIELCKASGANDTEAIEVLLLGGEVGGITLMPQWLVGVPHKQARLRNLRVPEDPLWWTLARYLRAVFNERRPAIGILRSTFAKSAKSSHTADAPTG